MGGHYERAALATLFTALSGSQHKAPGFAGGYLLNSDNSHAPNVKVVRHYAAWTCFTDSDAMFRYQ